ncbi:MAG: exosortase-associated protein EpsI, B-type [Burkholderiales bacterium]
MTTNSAASLTRRSALAAVLMAGAAATAHVMTPTRRLATLNGRLILEDAVPKAFADWRLDTNVYGGVVNPQTQELLNATYNQILTRTYVNSLGQRVMVSVAYGEDQTDSGVEIHHPEVCYPAQGFRLRGQRRDVLQTPKGNIPVTRLETSLANQRFEPVTYWIMIGDSVALGGLDKKLAELRHGLRGEIADGLLFRISTIDTDTQRSFAVQNRFVGDLVPLLPPASLARLTGLR